MLGLLEKFTRATFTACTTPTENFTDVQVKQSATSDALVSLLFIVLILSLVLLLGKWLWNDYLCKYITIFRPVKSVWHLVAVMVGLSLIMPTCC